MTGQRISGLYTLAACIEDKRAVVVPRSHAWRKPKPAAVVINLSGAILMRLFDMGMFVYEKEGEEIDAEFEPTERKVTNGKDESRKEG